VPQGRFITLEGGEGAGKTTQARLLSEALLALGLAVLRTREPGGAPGAEFLRNLLLREALDWSADAETLLHFAARAEHVEKTIRPALAAGLWVVCDRFADASYAYQGGGRGQPAARIEELERWACDGVKPDLTLLLDLPVAAGRARAAGRGEADRIESEADAFFERVRASYRARAAQEPNRFRVIDASQAPGQVLQAATHALIEWLEGSAR